jgi:uncharacterized membrane protein YbhN (UPF0104 family)
MLPDRAKPHPLARLAWLPKLLVSGALLWYIASRISLRALGEAIAGADPLLVGLGLALSAGGMAAAALQLRVVSEPQGIRLSAKDAFALNLATSFYNLLLPGALVGGVARWYRLTRSHAADHPIGALTVILCSRFVELTTVLVAGLLFWAADPLARSNHLVPATFAGLLVGLVLLGLAATGASRQGAGRRRTGGWSVGGVLPQRWHDRWDIGLDAVGRFRSMPAATLRRLVAASVARHLLMIAGFYSFALALHLPLTLPVAGWTRTTVALAGMLPVTIGGLGIREGSLIAVLHPYGVPAAAAAALGLLLFARELAAAAIGGIIEAHAFLSPTPADPQQPWGDPRQAEAGN